MLKILEQRRFTSERDRFVIAYLGCTGRKSGNDEPDQKKCDELAKYAAGHCYGHCDIVRLVTIGGCPHMANPLQSQLNEAIGWALRDLCVNCPIEVISLFPEGKDFDLFTKWFGGEYLSIATWSMAKMLQKALPHLARTAGRFEEMQRKIDQEAALKERYPFVGKVSSVTFHPHTDRNTKVLGADALKVLKTESFTVSGGSRAVVMCNLKDQNGVLIVRSDVIPFKFANKVKRAGNLRIHLTCQQAPLPVLFSDSQCAYHIYCEDVDTLRMSDRKRVWQLEEHEALDASKPELSFVHPYYRVKPVLWEGREESVAL